VQGEMNIAKWIILIFVIIGSGVFFAHSQNKKLKSGYCFAEKRFLSEHEFVEISVRKLISDESEQKSTAGSPDNIDDIEYETIQEFFSVNPNCCFVPALSGQKRGNPTKGEDGAREYSINIYHKQNGKREAPAFFSIYYVDVCGKVSGVDPLMAPSDVDRSLQTKINRIHNN
jgi:hypothetical protein